MRKVRNVLTKIFKDHPRDFDIRLWDGRSIGWQTEPRFTLVFRDKQTFKRIIMNGNALVAGAAFIENKLDIEGDLFAAIGLGDYLSGLKLNWRDKLSLLAKIMTI